MRATPRLCVALASLALAGGAAITSAPAGATPGGGGCSLSGTAKFAGGPNMTAPHAFTYTFTGTLSNCQSTMGTPASATIATLVPAKGGGGCPSSSTSGVALVTWADRSTTIISYTTQDIGAAVTLNGKVLPSYKVRKKVYRTTRGKDYNPYGYLVFGASPVECAGAGVTTATIAGVAGLQRNS